MSLENRDEAIREVKLFVRRIVRNDWAFDSTLYADGTRPGPASSPTLTDGTLCEGRRVMEWRCREFDSAGPELDPQSSDQSDSESHSPSRSGGITEIERRRRRRRRMADEMEWNAGLRMWMARRDEWTGARTQRQLRASERTRKLAVTHSQNSGAEGGLDAANAGGTSSLAKDAANTIEASEVNKAESNPSVTDKDRAEPQLPRQEQEEEQSTAPDEEKQRKESTETCITEPEQTFKVTSRSDGGQIDDKDSGDEQDSEGEDEELDEPLVPVAPPFISNSNPVRATITPTIYPSIYSKVVVQGLTPTIPINLADLTNAMVQGWKADGQWPPKPAVTSIVLQDDASVPKVPADSPAPASSQSRRKNSITNAMRKVFHMSTHPFHRRGSNNPDPGASQNNGNGTTA
ncbi:hypothetical protein N7539_001086 [Penicillium diatomitis]|uniref:Gag1-like clamp domain-containing protein n=1 Tax=Penicillium diatomitis TaxID=2819901 RepID=A0A9X0C398_9EURO|nr:uncharacterized protein N7539_001086 [Penicillium diatomitis]KAJ5495970.1 hypothetical protein N7539_001086 [Penicillium diatomitis]